MASWTLGVAVTSPAGTFAVPYPTGYAQADFIGANASATSSMVVNNNDRWTEAADKFDLSYDASEIVVTNKTGATLAVGSTILLQLARANAVEDFLLAGAVVDLAGTLTGTTTGTMADITDIALSTSDTYADAAVNAAVNAAVLELNLQLKELQTKVNEALAALRAAGVIAS
jgi:hypothetical protein